VPASPRVTGSGWLDRPETQAVFAALVARGFAARAVGGAVRNSLLGRPVVDIDIATTARPQEVINAAEAAGLKAVPTGLAHGTVTVVAGDRPYEVTTLRKDVETHGRHATVAFTDDWTADARRRDFTLNALYCDADGTVFDPLSGYTDLAARRVRFIGDAQERIREDYLRILRFFRLTADYGEGPADAAGLSACVRERAGLVMLSAERVRGELLRLLVAPRGPEIVALMLDYGFITPLLGAAPRPTLLARLAGLETSFDLAPDPILRLAALAVEVTEDAERLGERLRLSNAQTGGLLRAADRTPEVGPTAPRAAARVQLYRQGGQAYREQVLLNWARAGDPPQSAAWRHLLTLPERWRTPTFPLGGADVLAAGVSEGPRVGEILGALEEEWIAGGFSADAPGLRVRLKELASRR